MSFVITASEISSLSHCESRSTHMVFPEPTGPPMPRRNGRRLVSSGNEESGMGAGMAERGDFEEWIEPAIGRLGKECVDFAAKFGKRVAGDFLNGRLADA